MIKGSIQEDIILINIHELYKTAPKYIKQISTDIKGEIDDTMTVGGSTTSLTSEDKASRQKINKEACFK